MVTENAKVAVTERYQSPQYSAAEVHHGTWSYLGGFCLACPSRTSWGPSKLEVEGASEGEIDPVSEWCDDETSCVPQVFIAIEKLRVHCTHLQIITPVVSMHMHVGYSQQHASTHAHAHVHVCFPELTEAVRSIQSR